MPVLNTKYAANNNDLYGKFSLEYINNGIWIKIKNNPICDKSLFAFLSCKLFHVKYSNNCIEINENIYRNENPLITPLKYAKDDPKRLNKNVFNDTLALQHILVLVF